MKPKRRLPALLLALLAFAAAVAFAWLASRPPEGVLFAMNLTPGWNLANTLDAHGLGAGAGDAAVYERYWGSQPISRAQIKAIADAGFHTLRVPVTWFEHLDANNRIDPAWLARVRTVVDWGLAAGMHVIVNAHHDPWYEPAPDRLDAALAAMRAVWGQVAACFAKYDQRLLFEGMNEPRLLNHPEEWTAGTPEARACVNALNAAFVETVRACGGYNATRYLLVPAYAAGVSQEALEALQLPADGRVIVSVHVYVPYDFALNESGTAAWAPDVSADAQALRDVFARLQRLFVARGVPVAITEFGAVDKDNEAARAAWAATVTRMARDSRIPCMWWDTALMDGRTHAWRYPALLTALVR